MQRSKNKFEFHLVAVPVVFHQPIFALATLIEFLPATFYMFFYVNTQVHFKTGHKS